MKIDGNEAGALFCPTPGCGVTFIVVPLPHVIVWPIFAPQSLFCTTYCCEPQATMPTPNGSVMVLGPPDGLWQVVVDPVEPPLPVEPVPPPPPVPPVTPSGTMLVCTGCRRRPWSPTSPRR